MAHTPLMPKATAVWLVDNTSLTFEQIAEFCGLHVLEVKGIADGDVAHGIKGMDAISSGQLSRDEIRRGEDSPAYRLKLQESKVEIPVVKTKKGPRYTPVSRRQDRPNSIQWLLRYHPELKDSEIMRLVGTTKPTIQSIRDRSHWNSSQLQPIDPVTVGLCTQLDLDRAVRKAAERAEKERKANEQAQIKAGTLLPSDVTAPAPVADTGRDTLVRAADLHAQPAPEPEDDDAREGSYDADAVFAKLKDRKPEPEASDEDEDDIDVAATFAKDDQSDSSDEDGDGAEDSSDDADHDDEDSDAEPRNANLG